MGKRHQRKQRVSVTTNAFANGAGQLIIRPRANTGFRIRSEVPSNERTWQASQWKNLADPSLRSRRLSAIGPVFERSVTNHAAGNMFREVGPTLLPLRCGFEFPIGHSARSGAKERTPADGGTDAKNCEHQQHEHSDSKNFHKFRHSV